MSRFFLVDAFTHMRVDIVGDVLEFSADKQALLGQLLPALHGCVRAMFV